MWFHLVQVRECALTDIMDVYECKVVALSNKEETLQQYLSAADAINRQNHHYLLQTRVQVCLCLCMSVWSRVDQSHMWNIESTNELLHEEYVCLYWTCVSQLTSSLSFSEWQTAFTPVQPWGRVATSQEREIGYSVEYFTNERIRPATQRKLSHCELQLYIFVNFVVVFGL